MFCPFIQGACREDCAFHHMARAAVGNMTNNTMTCALAAAADALLEDTYRRTIQEEERNS